MCGWGGWEVSKPEWIIAVEYHGAAPRTHSSTYPGCVWGSLQMLERPAVSTLKLLLGLALGGMCVVSEACLSWAITERRELEPSQGSTLVH